MLALPRLCFKYVCVPVLYVVSYEDNLLMANHSML